MPPLDPAEGSTSISDGPSDEEMTDFLDDELGSVDDESEEDPDEEEADEDESDESDEDESDEDDDADADEDDDSDEEGDEEGDDVDPRLAAAERRAAEAEAVMQRFQTQVVPQAAAIVQAEIQRAQTATRLVQLRASMTDEEWQGFTQRLMSGFNDARVRQADQMVARLTREQQEREFYEAEVEAQDTLIERVNQEIKLNPLEKQALENTANAVQFQATFRAIMEHRRAQTEPARKAKREQRRANGSDRLPPRSNGASQRRVSGKGQSDDYNNYTDVDAMLDDVLAG